MGDAAHAESLGHEVFLSPLEVQPKIESRETPENYRGYPGGEDLPKEMKVWLVQKTGKGFGGVVARSYGFLDSPDTEILAKGFNRGKEYGAVGIGRHGNLLQWGYSAAPSVMTESGRRLFVNCIVYITKFKGKRPLVRRESSERTNAVRLAAVITRISGDKKKFFERTFPVELWDEYGQDPDGLVEYYRENREHVYRDGVYRVDGELRSLGIDSNREVATLGKLVGLLDDSEKGATAKKVLGRYTDESFETAGQWREWLDENRDRIYFTDVGGYKFLVTPVGYFDTQ